MFAFIMQWKNKPTHKPSEPLFYNIHIVIGQLLCIKLFMLKVLAAIHRRIKNLRFPTSADELRWTKQRFYQRARIPNCLGAIDGTHIPILAPRQREDLYVCRKGFHSINVQAVVDADMRWVINKNYYACRLFFADLFLVSVKICWKPSLGKVLNFLCPPYR